MRLTFIAVTSTLQHCVLQCLLLLLCFGVFQVHALPIQVGLIAFDPVVASAPPDPGTNAFKVYNLTGDPLTGGYASPVDFPVFTPLKFTLTSMSVVIASVQQSVILPDIDPGIFSDSGLEFSGSIAIESATFTATVGDGVVNLNDGTSWAVKAQQVSATLLPGSGSELTPGLDSIVLSLDGDPVNSTAVPEPATIVLMMVGLGGLTIFRRRIT